MKRSPTPPSPPGASENDLATFRVPLLLDTRRLVLLFLALALVLGAGWGGLRGYRAWRKERLVAKAEENLARGDYHAATLAARQVLQGDLREARACRVMARVTDAFGSREALHWWGHVAGLPSASDADRIAWASAALRFREFALADQALLSVRPESQGSAQFHMLAGMLAVEAKALRSAEIHFATVCQREPTNDLARLNLATVRLRSADPRVVEESRRILGELSDHPTHALAAQRSLYAAALEANRMEEAGKIADRLAANPQASWVDRLQRLQFLRTRGSPRFEAVLAQVQEEAVKRPEDAAQTILWMVGNGMARAALSWAERLPQALLERFPVPMALAEARAATGDWAGLRRHLEGNASWGEGENLRFAWRARASRELGDTLGSRRDWQSAVNCTRDRPADAASLARLARRWGWTAEAEDLFWHLATVPPFQKWALRQLFALLRERGDTRGLRRVVARALEFDPADKIAQNNLAYYSLLLRADVDAAHAHALALHQAQPSNTVFASTWAFALHVQGKSAEGLRVLNALPGKDLRHPALAACRGLLLAATGDKVAAAECLDLAKTTPLLPEERELVEAARRSLDPTASGKPKGKP